MESSDPGSFNGKGVSFTLATLNVSTESKKYDSPEEGITSVVLVVEGKKLHYTREVRMLKIR